MLAHLLTSTSVEEISNNTGISPRTIYRCLADEEFKRMFAEAKARLLDGAVLKLRNEASRAVDVLVEVAQDRYANPGARVTAARAIVQLAIGAGQLEELEAKVKELEVKTIDGIVGSKWQRVAP